MVAVTVATHGPTTSGVPLSTPVASSATPAGSAPPVTAKVGDGVPSAVKVAEVATPTSSCGTVPAIEEGGASTVPVNVRDTDPCALVALIVTE